MFSSLIPLVLPVRCPGCGRSGAPVCSSCAELLFPAAATPPPDAIDAWAAAFSYQGVARELIARIKYRGLHSASGWLAEAMVASIPLVPKYTTVDPLRITWAPTTRARRRARGFDHAQVLAQAVSVRLGYPARGLLGRNSGPPQTGLAAAARRKAPSFSPRRAINGTVLIVDDVATTGATLSAAARALRAAGATRVVALIAARTPSRDDNSLFIENDGKGFIGNQ